MFINKFKFFPLFFLIFLIQFSISSCSDKDGSNKDPIEVECESNSDCLDGVKTICDLENNICIEPDKVECESNSDCLDEIKIKCDLENNICIEPDPEERCLIDPNCDISYLTKVFQHNPLSTPEPVLVELKGIDKDQQHLTSELDQDNIRKLKVYSCVDQGETINIPGMGVQKICTLKQLANREENGDFIYEDWDNTLNGVYDNGDIYAEISLYYHASKIYNFVTSEKVGLGNFLSSRHSADGENVPINLIANYREPADPNSEDLTPVDMAFYSTWEHMKMGMSTFYGLKNVKGDFIILGQGKQTDMAYDADTIYHEFGHLITNTVGGLKYNKFVDRYGISNITNVIEQGVADSFVFLVSDNSLQFQYCDQYEPTGYTRDADNSSKFPDNLRGIDQFDSMIITGTNWEVFQLLKENYQCDNYKFARILIQTLEKLLQYNAEITLVNYGDALIESIIENDLSETEEEVRSILENRGLFNGERSKDISEYSGDSKENAIFTGGVIDAPWNFFLKEETTKETISISPAYIQTYIITKDDINNVTISANIFRSSSLYSEDILEDLDYKIYLRKDTPINYNIISNNSVIVDKDRVISPDSMEIDPSFGGDVVTVEWNIDNLDPNSRYYLHFVNYGLASGVVSQISVNFN